MPGKYEGKDNYGKPKMDYVTKVIDMTDEELYKETMRKIYMSAFANNNSRSDYHWHVDVCYEEWEKREKLKEYDRAYKEVTSPYFTK
ncbi:hypothetical protein CN918_29210 [Priestia megaterium]|nr:hypothetical protein CN918_29210 [Priestia megaterium]